jgi:hypothetical protein
MASDYTPQQAAMSDDTCKDGIVGSIWSVRRRGVMVLNVT